MATFRDIRIKQKLMIISMIASSVALLLVSVGLLAYEIVTSRQETLERLATLAEVIADNSIDALVFDDARSAADTLGALQAEKKIVSACIYRSDGRHFAGYRRGRPESECPKRAPVVLDNTRNDIAFALPMIVEGDQIGQVLIRSEGIDPFEQLGRYGSFLAVGALVSSLLALLLASKLQKFISGPILRLVDVAKRVTSEHDFSVRAVREGDDEIGWLIESFNEMLHQIEQKDAALAKHSEGLESEVALRTSDLVAAVDNLEEEIEQRKKAEEQIRVLAYYDGLTGLPNRQLLRDRLDRALIEASRVGGEVAVLFVDLDRFKEINDSLGHGAGDQLLCQVAERLLKSVRETDSISWEPAEVESNVVSRQGGDEFTVVLTSVRDAHDASRVANRILATVRDPFMLTEGEVVVGCSIGIAVYPTDGEDADTLIKHADTAMYHAKAEGNNEYQYYTKTMKEAALERITIENDLRKAIDRDEFELYYQPKIDIRSRRVVGVEALLRWRHPVDGLITPQVFMDVAESTGRIVAIGEWVVQQACRQITAWLAEGLPPFSVAVNVSAVQFSKPELLSTIVNALEESRIDPGMLELEITETAMMKDSETTMGTLRQLRHVGVSVSLDDFGTGYSSLSYVSRFPLDSLKIDRTFVAGLDSSEESAGIVNAIIAMAHSLGLTVVAEGVETEEQANLLRSMGCDQLQGFLYGRPVPATEVSRLIREIDAKLCGRSAVGLEQPIRSEL